MERADHSSVETADTVLGGGMPEGTVETRVRVPALGRMLDKFETELIEGGWKGTVAEYLRLIQIANDAAEERTGGIEIRWVNSDEL